MVATVATGNGYRWVTLYSAMVTIKDDDQPPECVPYVTGFVPGTVRNNSARFFGMKFVVGANPIIVTELGRLFLDGNSGTHLLKLINANSLNEVTATVNYARRIAGSVYVCQLSEAGAARSQYGLITW